MRVLLTQTTGLKSAGVAFIKSSALVCCGRLAPLRGNIKMMAAVTTHLTHLYLVCISRMVTDEGNTRDA